MPATGWVVKGPRGYSRPFKSGNPNADEAEASKLAKEMGEDYVAKPLGGAEAYHAVALSHPLDPLGFSCDPEKRRRFMEGSVIFFDKMAQLRREGHSFTCDFE